MYNKFNAFTYELIIFLCRFYPLKRKPFIQKILDYCLDDWAAFRAEVAMKEVDEQVQNIQREWEQEEKEKLQPTYLESKPDGSKAQALLGGEIRLTSPWVESKRKDV
jgi:hypothetical protein